MPVELTSSPRPWRRGEKRASGVTRDARAGGAQVHRAAHRRALGRAGARGTPPPRGLRGARRRGPRAEPARPRPAAPPARAAAPRAWRPACVHTTHVSAPHPHCTAPATRAAQATLSAPRQAGRHAHRLPVRDAPLWRPALRRPRVPGAFWPVAIGSFQLEFSAHNRLPNCDTIYRPSAACYR
jgi:hypothetical protein